MTPPKINRASTTVKFQYVDFVDVFSPDFIARFLEYIRINDYLIDLVDSQQLCYQSIYNLKLVELETLKTYIRTNLAQCFENYLSLP